MLENLRPEEKYEAANTRRTLEAIRAAETQRIARLGTDDPYGQRLGLTVAEARGALVMGYALKISFWLSVILITIEVARRVIRRQ